MRHRKSGLKLNRTSSHRNAMFRNMVTSLFKHDRIKTTDAKAKELRRWADNLVTLAKRGDLHARRQALAIIQERKVVDKLFNDAQDKYGSSNGGYTRITKIGLRSGDAASMSLIELIASEKPKAATKKDSKPKKVKPAPEEETEVKKVEEAAATTEETKTSEDEAEPKEVSEDTKIDADTKE